MSLDKRLKWLTEWFDKLQRVDPLLIEELTLTYMPTRLFRRGAAIEADIVMETVVHALGSGLVKHHPELPDLIKRLHKNFKIVAVGGDKAGFAYNELRAVQREWNGLRHAVEKTKVDGAADFAGWLDRETDELLSIAAQRRKVRPPPPTPAVAKAAAGGQAARRTGQADGRRVYKAFVDVVADAPPVFLSLERLGILLGPDDPVWGQIEKAVQAVGTRSADALADRIQGILGEALAVRHPWVTHSLTEAAERARTLRTLLGDEWKVVFVEGETYATKTAGEGLGQLYDASVWLVRKGSGGDVAGDAVPIWVLEVKSGLVSEAPKQIRKDFVREIGTKGAPTVTLPVRGTEGARYRLKTLRELTAGKADPGKAGIDLSTRRVLVTPRAPTDSSLVRELPKGVAVDYVPALMSRQQLRESSQALARRLKALARTAK